MTSEARRPTVRLAPLPPSVCGDIKGGKEGGLSGGGGGGSGGRGGSLGAWQASGGGRDGGGAEGGGRDGGGERRYCVKARTPSSVIWTLPTKNSSYSPEG